MAGLDGSEAWRGVDRVPQDDGPRPVVPIAYSREFVETMDFFRAVVRADERSERALKLTELVIDQNAANYTAWHFRRLCLEALQKDLGRELRFCAEVAQMAGSKNYQLWWHRRVVVGWLLGEDPKAFPAYAPTVAEREAGARAELQYTEEVLREDAKNYHPWAFRKWVLHTFGVWDGELAYVDALLDSDVRNNSAYAHRFYVVESSPAGFDAAAVTREAAYAADRIGRAPHNESAWNYYRGVLARDAATDEHRAEAERFCLEQRRANPTCAPAWAALVDFDAASGDPTRADRAREACRELAATVDPVRREYWKMREAQIE